jgi:anti-sigma regulatory factor (Ser/Thr protein kinase)
MEQVCAAIAQELEKSPLQPKDRFAAELLAREALNNAVMHGCHENPQLCFACRLTLSDQEMIIEVSDEGGGFDWRKKMVHTPTCSGESGRGLCIYALYANLITYNDAGNCVTLTRVFNA